MAELLPGECGGVPHEGLAHEGPVRPYVRICPHAHLRAGYACDGCHGEHGAVMCNDCEGDKPAILIPAVAFSRMPFEDVVGALVDMVTGEILAEMRTRLAAAPDA